jgi:hypothetical protein
MSAASDRVLERIRKLLNLAGNNPSVEEAATAMSMAMRLMAKHNLEEADVIRANLKSSKTNVTRHVFETGPNFQKQVAMWYNILVTGTSRTLSCHTSITRGARNQLTLATHGYHSDVMVVVWLVEYIQEQSRKLVAAAWTLEAERIREQHGRAPWASERTRMKEQYLEGMISRVLQRVAELYGEVATATEAAAKSSNALALVKDAAVLAQYPALVTDYEARTTDSSSDHVLAGVVDARHVQLHKVLNTNLKEERALLLANS